MSVASAWGFALVGIEAVPVRVEAHARNGLPGVAIVGLPGAAVREARERVRSGAASAGFPLPTRRITINLSPGDVPKDVSRVKFLGHFPPKIGVVPEGESRAAA
jgi:hypothetical protein